MRLRFTKMHGLGNDFMVIDGINQSVNLSCQQIQSWSNRFTGVGFDQCLVIEKSTRQGIDFMYRIFNANGQEVGQCGNGARCLGLFVKHYNLSSKSEITIATTTTTMRLLLDDLNCVTVDFGPPQWQPDTIPLLAESVENCYALPLENQTSHLVHALSVGNPHAVTRVSNIAQADLNGLGARISTHPLFVEGCNAGFMEIIDASTIKLRVYERGCGETRACGSGAVAAAAVARKFYKAAPQIEVQLPGGRVFVHWPDNEQSIFLKGKAEFVYEATVM